MKEEMEYSHDESEAVPENVSDYEFLSRDNGPVSFAELPLEWSEEGATHGGKPREIFLSGETHIGLPKIFKQVIAWKFDLPMNKPEISVLSVDGYWIKLLMPCNPFHDINRTILITVHLLHFVKWNPLQSQKALWDHLTLVFSMYGRSPCADDLVDHLPLIDEAVKRDEILADSKILRELIVEKPWESTSDEVVRSLSHPWGDEDDLYDSVCAICDNGGHVLLCDGKCMRSFHATVKDGEYSTCESLGLTDAELQALKDVSFYCANCKYKKHQCFGCGELGSSDETSNAEVFRCLNGACGYFYHPYCVAKLLHPGNSAAAEELKQRIGAGEQFACPAHRCHVCKELEVRSIKEFQFAVCRRCPRAYHRKCLPREITSADDVNKERGIIQRAWEENLIPNRILIYCLDHEIDPDILMPVRDHLKFPGVKKCKRPLESSKNLAEESSLAAEDYAGIKISAKGDLCKTKMQKFSVHLSSKRRKVATDECSLEKTKQSITHAGDISFGGKLYDTYYNADSQHVESSNRDIAYGKNVMIQKVKSTAKIDDSVNLDTDTRRRILGLMKNASSSVTLNQLKQRITSPSTHVQSRFLFQNITLGKVESSVQALSAALKKLVEGGCVQDAKAVCSDALLLQVLRWRERLKVYLAPFLHGMRYTSFGRHFTKVKKLKEIANILHWYVQDGDMLVDFCCGSNDFSCLMKKKLDRMGKSCLFKNYDIVQAKNDFNFERRDWMDVKPDELLDGSRLIMGLNPPFGVNAALANKFINKALEFKPKLLILIIPRETRRLDEKESPYDLIWQNDHMLAGKSFYLPGSVDLNGKQLEDWNVNAPLLALWSSPNWTHKHRAIAEERGHLELSPHASDFGFRASADQRVGCIDGSSRRSYIEDFDGSHMRVHERQEALLWWSQSGSYPHPRFPSPSPSPDGYPNSSAFHCNEMNQTTGVMYQPRASRPPFLDSFGVPPTPHHSYIEHFDGPLMRVHEREEAPFSWSQSGSYPHPRFPFLPPSPYGYQNTSALPYNDMNQTTGVMYQLRAPRPPFRGFFGVAPPPHHSYTT